MATKKDLLEAQNFSKARLLSAFVGGAPGGKELEPAKPMRAVFVGIALTLMVILAGVFIGLIQPKLPSGWENNRLIVASDTGARYISVAGELHPVINTVSARMAIPAGEFKVVTVKQGALEGIPIGGTVGILGAPDTLPEAGHLDGTGWAACATSNATTVQIGDGRMKAAPTSSGIVVERDGETFVISGGMSYLVPEESRTPVLRAMGLDAMAPVKVRGEWLALFARGSDLTPMKVTGTDMISDVDMRAGSVIRPTGGDANERYLLTPDGSLARMSDLAFQLYQLGSGSGELGKEINMSPAEIAELPTTDAAGEVDWPQQRLTPVADAAVPCATLAGSAGDQRTVLAAGGSAIEEPADETTSATAADGGATAAVPTDTPSNVRVAKDGGALVRGGSAGVLTLIDGGGTAYALPGEASEGAARLGYTMDDVDTVPAPWIQLLLAGPALTPEAAGSTPEAS
ncbi:type VII secretion protein EccB [Leucobacter sp. NPDC058333]|uniref:type VII secretion protein EccB n=1 Tax=Leucobacter sp. NPDC058333 TaxID=3346450 RepID=UPI003663C831